MSSSLSWGSIRRIRRVGGALAIELEPAGTFAVPVRVFRDREQRTFELSPPPIDLWGAALRVYLGGGTGAMTSPYEVEIHASGYRVRLGNADSWTSWDSFESARRVGPVYALRVRGSTAEVVLSARGFSPADQTTFREVLQRSGIKGA